MKDLRRLPDLAGIGPAALKDFEILGVDSVTELKKQNPQKLYDDLCEKTKKEARHLCPGCIFGSRGSSQ